MKWPKTDEDTKIKTTLTGMINRKKGGLYYNKQLPW